MGFMLQMDLRMESLQVEIRDKWMKPETWLL